MFTLQIFTEILVVGALLMLGSLPLLLLIDKKSLKKGRPLPFVDHFDSTLPVTFILLVVAYAVGAAGNRLVDSLWDSMNGLIDMQFNAERHVANSEDFYKDLLVRYLDQQKQPLTPTVAQQSAAAAQDSTTPGPRRINCKPIEGETVNCIKAAEFALRERSASTREWFDNRRTYIRIMRAASFSALLLIFSMGVSNVVAWFSSKRTPPAKHEATGEYLIGVPGDVPTEVTGAHVQSGHTPYRWFHFLATAVLLAAFAWANVIADKKYWQRVYEVYAALPPETHAKDK